jgi:protein tyrosine/serine phosphatase
VLAGSAEAARVLLGSNEHTVIEGKVYRSAQLSQQKLERVIAEKKIRTVINLRGCCPDMGWYMGDARATFAAGISQEDVSLSAKRHPPPSEIRRLIEVFDHTQYPVLLHCAQGADRTGLASTIALLLQDGTSLREARRQMWPRYGHIAFGRTALLDAFFNAYETWLAARGLEHKPDTFRVWVAKEYCPGPFRAELALVAPAPFTVPAGVGFVVTVRATNRSVEPWQFTPGRSGGIHLRYTLHAKSGKFIYRGHAGLFTRTVYPGESIDLAAGFPPVDQPGPYVFHADLLDAQAIDLLDTDFAQYGSEPLIAGLEVR